MGTSPSFSLAVYPFDSISNVFGGVLNGAIFVLLNWLNSTFNCFSYSSEFSIPDCSGLNLEISFIELPESFGKGYAFTFMTSALSSSFRLTLLFN